MASSPGGSGPRSAEADRTARVALLARVRDPGFTPGVRDWAALLDLFASEDEEIARATERAALRIEVRHRARVVRETVARAQAATRPARGRLTKLVGRLAVDAPETVVAEARAWLVAALADADPKTRHTAARALGKLRPGNDESRAALEQTLLEAWERGGDDEHRALAEALGKIGARAAREHLATRGFVNHATDGLAKPPTDGLTKPPTDGLTKPPTDGLTKPPTDGLAKPPTDGLARRATRAVLMIDRSAARARPGAIALSQAFESPLAVRFHTRHGLEGVVESELGERWRSHVAGPGRVDARLEGPLARAAAIRTASHFGFPLGPVPVRDGLAEAIVRAIVDPRSLAILRAFTDRSLGDPIRFRLAWSKGGHRRALAWRCAELVATASSELVNDPTESTWEIVVDDGPDRVCIELVPRGFQDERFAYRQEAVPASSHPSIAAALVRLAPASRGDVVWDPFVGAGSELIERARLGPYARLIGTDVAPSALDAARANLAAAGIADATLDLADATIYAPRGVSVIVTNPPMGRRVERGTHGALLERFVDHAARVLVPGGVLVWAVPDARRLHARAERAGLVLERAFTVDMGGFPAELSIHRKASAESGAHDVTPSPTRNDPSIP